MISTLTKADSSKWDLWHPTLLWPLTLLNFFPFYHCVQLFSIIQGIAWSLIVFDCLWSLQMLADHSLCLTVFDHFQPLMVSRKATLALWPLTLPSRGSGGMKRSVPLQARDPMLQDTEEDQTLECLVVPGGDSVCISGTRVRWPIQQSLDNRTRP